MAFDTDLYGKSTVLETWAVQPRFGAIFIGALLCLASQVFFCFLNTAIGFAVFHLEAGQSLSSAQIASGSYLAFSIFLSFFLGGYVAARLANQPFRISTLLHGLGVWALVSLSLVVFAGTNSLTLAGQLFQNVTGNELKGLLACSGLALGAIAAFLGALSARRPLIASTTGYTSQRPVPKVA